MPATRLTKQYCKKVRPEKTREEMFMDWDDFNFLIDVQLRRCHMTIPEVAEKMERSSDRIRVWRCAPGEFRVKDLANLIACLAFKEEEWQELVMILFRRLIKEAQEK